MELFRGWHLPGCWDCCSLRSHVFGLVSGFNKVAWYGDVIQCGYPNSWMVYFMLWKWMIWGFHPMDWKPPYAWRLCSRAFNLLEFFFPAPSSHIRLLLGCANGSFVACWGCQVLGYWSWNRLDICKITGMSIRKCLGCLRCLECLHLQVTDFDAKR